MMLLTDLRELKTNGCLCLQTLSEHLGTSPHLSTRIATHMMQISGQLDAFCTSCLQVFCLLREVLRRKLSKRPSSINITQAPRV